ncbi:MAG: hypothetical protein KY454_13675 [Actinobacteria bacterium]|nr:hypothetical protein [Actinomycetota bacterium]
MSRRQRWILGAMAGLLGVAAVVALVVGGSSRGGPEQRLAVEAGPAGTTTTSEAPASTDTTVALVPVTTGVPVPTTPTTATAARGNVRVTPAPAGSPSASGPAGPPPLGADGAVLAPPSPPPPSRPIDKARGCHSAVDPGWKIVDCGALRTSGTVLVWLVESRGKGLRALVLKEQAPGQWATVLRAADDDGSRFSSIGVRGEDVSGDGQPELAFGFHRRGPDRVLAFDLVEASGAVAVHRELPHGSVTLSKGEFVTWAATGDGRAQRSVVRHAGGAWRIVASETVDRSAVPQSMV